MIWILTPKLKYPINNFISNNRLSKSHAYTVNQLFNVSIPSNIQKALADPQWKKSMNDEMEALQKNSIWKFVPLLDGKKW